MTMTKQDKARQRRAASVEYRVQCFGAYGLLLEDVQFLATPVLHVNGPGDLAYHVINMKFISRLCFALGYANFRKLVYLGNYSTMIIFRVNPDGSMYPVLTWQNNEAWREFACWKHPDCTLYYTRGLF